MGYQICKICGSMFEKDGREYCEECFAENEKEFDLVLDYIEKHPDHTVLDITTETKVSLKSINRFVEQGSISYKDKD